MARGDDVHSFPLPAKHAADSLFRRGLPAVFSTDRRLFTLPPLAVAGLTPYVFKALLLALFSREA
jgi:hypothetical protein